MEDQPHFRLSDNQWDALAKHVALPAEARPRIEEAIALYRIFESGMKSDDLVAARRSLGVLANALGDAFERIEALPPAAIHALFRPACARSLGGAPIGPADLIRRFEERKDAVRQLASWLSTSVDRVPAKTPNNDRSNNLWLARRLDAIVSIYTGRSISRSHKSKSADFVRAVFKIARPSIGLGSIDEAMKEAIKRSVGRAVVNLANKQTLKFTAEIS